MNTVTASPPRIHLPRPTFGGKQLWRDGYLHANWRIQENILSGTNRLLDPRHRCWATGSYEACRQRFDSLRKDRPIEPRSSHLILLIHGIARSTGTFRKLAPALRDAGYDAAAISYPSTRTAIETHADGVARLLNRLEGARTVSFVTHSMGALVLRCLLAERRPWQRTRTTGRLVLVAPPNQGAAMAEILRDRWLYRTMYGPAGQQLVTETAQNLPGLAEFDFAIIAGGRGRERGFNPELTGDDDGTETIAETALAGWKASHLVRGLHAGLANHPDTVGAVLSFIAHGTFPESQPQTLRRNS
ncbi:MAG: alpha/beta fold hydrolase [Rhodospirillaceae bacterium]|nr:alpha/beta fold hydrolase [Rhodospirillaceae bacterium]